MDSRPTKFLFVSDFRSHKINCADGCWAKPAGVVAGFSSTFSNFTQQEQRSAEDIPH